MGEQGYVEKDRISIADEVIGTIAGIAVNEIDNVILSGGSVWGRKNTARGVKVSVNNEDINLDISITVNYGCKIHIVSSTLQKKVRQTVQDMTGMSVKSVNVNVLGVNVGRDVGQKEMLIKEEAEQYDTLSDI